jgi:L-iditol 2-dehydrogenase
MGATKIINVGGPKERRGLAREFGADVTISIDEVPETEERLKMVLAETAGGYGADVVLECAGNPHAFQEGLSMVRRSGTFVEMGNFTDTGSIEINPFWQICNKNINLQGSWGAETEHFVRGLAILEKGDFPYAKLVTHKIPLRRLNEIIDLPEKGYLLDGKIAMKVVVETALD